MNESQEQNPRWRNSLREYLHAIPVTERQEFANRCGTTIGHLNQVAYGKYCNIEVAVAVHRETSGTVSMQDMYPSLDWDYVRQVLASKNISFDAKATRESLHNSVDGMADAVKEALHKSIEDLPLLPMVKQNKK
jgi:DNA-binding transcriptional regulator YdaS (Cro superfamily)